MTTSRHLRPGKLAQDSAARTALDTAGVALDCTIPPVRLSPDANRTLGLALREAIINIVRHASATSCAIRLDAADDAVRLEIKDGIGGRTPDSSGWSGMRARVAEAR